MSKERRVRESLENALVLTGAAWGAATGKSMQRSPTEKYLTALDREPPSLYNPEERTIEEGFTSRLIHIASKQQLTVNNLLTVPWSLRRIKPSRLAASLIAFSNDHGKKTVQEYFPADAILSYLSSVQTYAQEIGHPLTVFDQYDLALQQTNNNPVAAAILAHSAYRSVARSSDTRLDKRLSFEVDSPNQSVTMMSIARSTADFAINDKRDPLGNTYHWWSQFTAGMVFVVMQKQHPIQTEVYDKAFSRGPELTVALRNKLQRLPLDAGDHKQVDRQGRRMGRAMGQLIVDKIKIQ